MITNETLDVRVGERACLQVLFGDVYRNFELAAHLALDLNHGGDRLFLEEGLINLWVRHASEWLVVAQHVPHVLRRVWSDEAQEQRDNLSGFTHGWVGRAGAGIDDLTGRVGQLHRVCNDNVELAVLEVLQGFGEVLVRHGTQVLIAGCEVGARLARDILGNAPRTRQELAGARWGNVSPVDVVFRWRREDHGQTDRVHTELVELFAQVHAVTEGLGHRLALVQDLPLVEQSLEWLVEVEVAEALQRLGDEARVQQVKDRVLNAANVLVDRQPALDRIGIKGGLIVVRRSEAQVVPGRVDERVHRVGIALSGTAAFRARDVDPFLSAGKWRTTLEGKLLAAEVLRQTNWKLGLWNRDLTAGLTVDDRDRCTPEALTRNEPVTQAVSDGLVSRAGLLNDLDGLGDRVLFAQPIERARVDEGAVANGCYTADSRVFFAGVDDGADR